jgi:FkbM family methyltransferase
MKKSSLSISDLNKEKWYTDGQEKKLRYNYDLNNQSVVIDVGGYEGDFAAEIVSRYQCSVYVFEPVSAFVDILKDRFSKNQKIKIIAKGLGASNSYLDIHVMDEASSFNRSESDHKKGNVEKIQIVDVYDFFMTEQIEKVDLIKINIEGAEYDLLDRMIANGLIQKCTNLQVQFHDFYPDFSARYKNIYDALTKTHVLTYRYPFVWENWQTK